MVALISAGCSNTPAETGNTGTGNKNATTGTKTVKFADCMRENGVKQFPDPNGSSDQEFVEAIEKLDTGSAAFKKAIGACKDLQPPGLLGGKASPKQTSARLKFAQCIRDNGVKDFPDPANDAPLVDTNRIPSANRDGGMTILNAAMEKCRDAAEDAMGDAVTRKAWVLAAAAVTASAAAAWSRCQASTRPHAGAGEHRQGAAGGALVHGLPAWDPDLSGAIGRLAVRRDQPGPRDLHQAARRGRQGRLRRRALSGRRRPGAAAVWHGPGLPRPGRGDKGKDVRQLNRNLRALGYNTLKALQRDKGLAATGTLALGDAVFLPKPVRIAKVTGELGGSARPGAQVAQATSDTLEVQVNLDASQQGEVKKGDRAQITLPGNKSVTGKVERLGRVARTAGKDDAVGDATIPAYISLDEPKQARGLDRAPVQVDITTKGVESALSVPVTALVGKSGGGFAVEVVRDGGRRELVAVELGLFDTTDGRVQVEGDLAEGDQVVVPSL